MKLNSSAACERFYLNNCEVFLDHEINLLKYISVQDFYVKNVT